jgi:hypothetical protein
MSLLKSTQCPRCLVRYVAKTQRRLQGIGSWCTECQCALMLSLEDAAYANLVERPPIDTPRPVEQIYQTTQEGSGDAQLNAGLERPRPSREMEIIPFD